MAIALQLTTLGSFLLYFASASALVGVFLLIYTRLTPWHEFALIRAGSTAAAISLAGAVLGFILPLSSAIAHSVAFVDMLIWGVVAMVIQILVFLVVRVIEPDLKRRIEAGEAAAAGKLGVFALGFGILNAACMTY
jgi:putative membrane protein